MVRFLLLFWILKLTLQLKNMFDPAWAEMDDGWETSTAEGRLSMGALSTEEDAQGALTAVEAAGWTDSRAFESSWNSLSSPSS